MQSNPSKLFKFTPEQAIANKNLVHYIYALYQESLHNKTPNQGILTDEILHAFSKCPRHTFCHPQYVHLAYDNRASPILANQVISQPSLVCSMTACLNVKAGDRVFEVGTGSGYQAAILATMGVKCYTMEIIEELYDITAPKLNEMYPDLVKIRRGDAFNGWPEYAPFDGIVVTAGIDKTPPRLIQQLKIGGNIVIPIEDGTGKGHILYCYTKTEYGMKKAAVSGCCFVPFTREKRE